METEITEIKMRVKKSETGPFKEEGAIKMEGLPVLITGVGGTAGRSAVKYFIKKGFTVIGTDIRDIEAPVDSFYKVPAANERSFPTFLIEIIKKERPFLLIPTVTEELHTISRLKKVIEAYGCIVAVASPDAIDIANDKLKTVIIMAGNGISVPVSFDDMTPKEIIIKTLNFPIISKPRVGRSGRGVTLYRNPEELLRERKTGLIFQEFIPGEAFGINMFIDKNGNLWSDVVLKKTSLMDRLTENALEVERVEREDLEEFGKKAAQILNLTGPIDMDVRLREDGTPVLLEIKSRLGVNVLSAIEVLDSLLIASTQEELSVTNFYDAAN